MTCKATVAGFQRERLARLDRFFAERYVEPGLIPGISMRVFRRGELAHHTTLGLADRERGRVLREDTIFRLYSMSKPITSVALMMLVEEGAIALEDAVARFIPRWADLRVFEAGGEGAFETRPCDRPMRIIDLLRHTSGLTYGFQQRSPVDALYRALDTDTVAREGSAADLVRDLGDLPLEFSPGRAWNYSVSTDVLGHIIAEVSGLPLDVFLRRRIFEPLGMEDTDFFVPHEKRGRLASCYTVHPEGCVALYDDAAESVFLKPRSFLSGGGGLVGTADDYLRFCQMLLDGGALDGQRLLSPKTVELMGRNHLPGGADIPSCALGTYAEAALYKGVGFGLGFSVLLATDEPANTRTVGAFSWGGAASTFFWIDPAEELIGLFMAQLVPSNAHPIHAQMRTLVYGAMTESNTWPGRLHA